MFNMKKLLLIILLLNSNAYAADVTLPTTYSDGDTVTAANLNANPVAIAAVVNGGLDNDNANTANGYRFYEFKATLPSAGTQGRAVFQASDNTFNLDNGSAWLATVTPTGTLATGKIPYYNGGWSMLAPGSQYQSLVSNGASSLPSYQNITLTSGNGVTGILPIANGGTGQATAQAAADALLPSQSGNSGKVLTTNGSASSWGSNGMELISTTAVSSTTTSASISFTSTERYMVVVTGKDVSAGANVIGIRVNSDTGNNYFSGYSGRGATAATGASNSGTSFISTADGVQASQAFYVKFSLAPDTATSTFELVDGTISGNLTTAGLGVSTFGGSWRGAATPTSFTVIGTANYTGTIYLYKLTSN